MAQAEPIDLTGAQVVFFDIGETLATPHFNAAGRLASLEPLPGVSQALARLRDAGLRLGIISNTGEETSAALRQVLTDAGLYVFFAPEPGLLIYSAEVHMTKDSPAIFRLACDRAGHRHDPGRCLFVGENPDERDVASEAGLPVASSPAEVAAALRQP